MTTDTPALVQASPAASAAPSPAFEFAAPATPAAEPAEAISLEGYRIRIPRLGIDLAIAEGDLKRDIEDQRTPENLALHLPGTSQPGRNDNTYLYAHARSGMFLSLWNTRIGDEILISALGGQVFVYVVREILPWVAPDDVSVAGPSSAERLTLQTSTGPSPSDPRFVVLAYPRGG